MSAPLQRRAPSRPPPRHGARTAEALHHLQRSRALAREKREKQVAEGEAGLQDARRETSSTQANGVVWVKRSSISGSPALTGSGSASLLGIT